MNVASIIFGIRSWWNNRRISVVVDDEKIVEHKDGSSNKIYWDDISEVLAKKVDMTTYEEIFVTISSSDGTAISIGELDKCFKRFYEISIRKLELCIKDWMNFVEEKEVGNTIIIYSSNK